MADSQKIIISGIKEAVTLIQRFALQRKTVVRAIDTALNRTTKSIKAQAGRDIAKKSGVPLQLVAGRLKAILTESVGNKDVRSGKVSAISYSVPSILLNPEKTPKGIKAGRFFYRSAFIGRSLNGHVKVFRRKFKSRLPLREMRAPIQKVTAQEFEAMGLSPQIAERLIREIINKIVFYALPMHQRKAMDPGYMKGGS
jgi:hypothetical protein